ncbi:hypothetical protein C1H46_040175 [Malus baccata]|uniref:Uncharacterized protein n=1 Tax=Malus baccata TaxID=106549 RepID=A0A540KJA8_MALBA|nr:hypothetical protein C1H46_040175 [Malus baccata]
MVSLLKSLVDPRKNWFTRQHMKVVSQRLCHYGRLYDPYYDLDINKALSRLSREIVDARNQCRIPPRASSQKKKSNDLWIRPKPARFNWVGLGPVPMLCPAFKSGSGSIPSKLGLARAQP